MRTDERKYMERKLGINIKKVLCLTAVFMLLIVWALPAANASADQPLITVSQVFTTSGNPETFTYSLKPLETGSPMPEGSTAEGYTFTIIGTDSVTIEMAQYNREGVYRYKLLQVIGASKPGYKYDTRVYMIEVHVYEEQYIVIVVYNEDSTKAGTIVFQNSYSGGGTTNPPTNPPPTTEPPTTEPPTTEIPTTEPPTTEFPPTDPPTTEPPTTEMHSTEPPLTELPTTDPAGGGKGGGTSPKTGDDSNYDTWLRLFVLGAIVAPCAAAYLIFGKKSKKEIFRP